MTSKEALLEARRRWGSHGSVEYRTHAMVGVYGVGVFVQVRVNDTAMAFYTRGCSPESWEAAFVHADHVEKRIANAVHEATKSYGGARPADPVIRAEAERASANAIKRVLDEEFGDYDATIGR